MLYISLLMRLYPIQGTDFHNIQYPCKVITVIIRTFRPFAHYWAVKGWQSAAGLAIENRRKEKLRR